MGFLFLFLGYMGVPVAFALIASVLIVTMFTPVSAASMMAQLFNGMDTEALLAVPFFLLVGDLMTSANVTVRMITLSQAMVGHFRGRRRHPVAHAGAGNEAGRLRSRLHGRLDCLCVDHGEPDSAEHHGGGVR